MQEAETARCAVYENDYATMAKLLVNCTESVVVDYIRDHKNGLHVVCNNDMWLQFEREILELDNLEVRMSDFHIAYAKQCIEYIADAADDGELMWRLWLCLWVVGFESPLHCSTCLAYIMHCSGVGCTLSKGVRQHDEQVGYINSIHVRKHKIDEMVPIGEDLWIVHTVMFVCKVEDVSPIRAWGYRVSAYDGDFLSDNTPLQSYAERSKFTVTSIVQMLQQVTVRPPDRIMQLLGLPRFTTVDGKEV